MKQKNTLLIISFIAGTLALISLAVSVQQYLSGQFKKSAEYKLSTSVNANQANISRYFSDQLRAIQSWLSLSHDVMPSDRTNEEVSRALFDQVAEGLQRQFKVKNIYLVTPQQQVSLTQGSGFLGVDFEAPNTRVWLNKLSAGQTQLKLESEGYSDEQLTLDSEPDMLVAHFFEQGFWHGHMLILQLDPSTDLQRLLSLFNADTDAKFQVYLAGRKPLFDGLDSETVPIAISEYEGSGVDLVGYLSKRSQHLVTAWRWDAKYQFGVLVEYDFERLFSVQKRLNATVNTFFIISFLLMVVVLVVVKVSRRKLDIKQGMLAQQRNRLAEKRENIKQQQKALEKSQARLSHIQDLSKIASLEVDVVSDEFIWHIGFEPLYILLDGKVDNPKDLFAGLSDTQRDNLKQCYEQACMFRRKQSFELYFKTSKLGEKYYHVNSYPQFGEASKVKSVLILIVDVTEQKQSQNRALSTEIEYRDLILDSTEDGIVSVDLSGAVTLVNPAAYSMLGFRKRDMLNKPFHQLVHHSDDKQQPIELERTFYYQSCVLGESVRGQSVLWRRDNSYFPVEFISNPIKRGGKPVGAVYVFRDISQQQEVEDAIKASEQRFKRVIDATADAMFDWHIESDHIFWNQRFWQLLGYSQQEAREFEANNETWQKTVHPDDLQLVINTMQAHLVYEDPYELTYRLVSKMGDVIWAKARGQAVKEDDKIVYVSGTVTDITELKRAEDEKDQLRAQLLHAQKMEAIGQLTRGIAHDFNNILASVLGYAELSKECLEMAQQEKVDGYLNQVISSGERARDLVKQMMVFSRSEEQSTETHGVDQLLTESMRMIKPMLTSAMAVDLQCDSDLAIEVDFVQFQQLLMNLCINARDAMNSKGSLTVSARKAMNVKKRCAGCHSQFSGDFLYLVVKDSGPGMTPEIIERIFDPYFTTKPTGEGTGMGLAIVHGIVHQANAHIVVNSQPDSGCEFGIYWPLIERRTLPAAQNKSEQMLNLPLNKEKHVLIVDDEATIANLLDEVLKRQGLTTTVCYDSVQALSVFTEQKDDIDLVITDQTMPIITGVELANAMLESKPELPIVICSGYSKDVNETLAKQKGVRAFLGKPIDFNQLNNILSDIW